MQYVGDRFLFVGEKVKIRSFHLVNRSVENLEKRVRECGFLGMDADSTWKKPATVLEQRTKLRSITFLL